MHELENYIKKSLSVIFFSILIPLFSIASIIFLIKLATYTAYIQLSIWEMLKLFFFMVPELLFHTLPITFFIAATLTLFKLSNDNEVVVLFALGIHPKKILKVLFKPALLLTTILALNFYFVFPHTKILSKNFVLYKKNEAQFNLSASEFGHKFGDWLLYIGKENIDGSYSNVVLFNKKEEGEEILIEAKRAEIINNSGILKLKLTEGEGYTYSKEKLTQLNFKTLFINDQMKVRLYDNVSSAVYWFDIPKYTKKFISNTLLALFPVFSLFFIASIGIVHVRHQKAKVYLFLFLGILVYYSMSLSLNGVLSFYAIPVVSIVWLISTYLLYKKQIVAKF